MKGNNMKEKKYSGTQIIRHIIQLAAFILFPELFILVWNSAGTIYKAVISGTFTFSSMISNILILLAVIPISILWGRFFCGYLCAFGSMQEVINAAARKLKIKQIKIGSKADKILKKLKYVIIIVLVALWTVGISSESFSPWNVFGVYSTYKGWSDFDTFLSIGGVLLLLIIILSLFVERFFCRYFCPLGGVFSLISKPRLYKIKKRSDKCVRCNLCTAKCSMGIDVNYEINTYGKIKSGECIDCFECMNVCNFGALYTNPKEAVSGTLAAVAITGMYYAGNLVPLSGSSGGTASETSVSHGKYKDGTYQGSAQGYRGQISVKVKVESGSITSIEITSYEDDDRFFNSAKSGVIDEIINSQSVDVSTLSGATYSSQGIISAVAAALGENSSYDVQITEQSTSTTAESTAGTTASDSAFANLSDGTYSGSGSGRNGDTAVKVKVKNGKVTSITIESYMDDEEYFARAKAAVPDEIISEQSLEVSTVAGATMSSNSIIAAVADALDISYTNPNSSMGGAHKGFERY